MAQIEQLEKMAEKAATIFALTWDRPTCRNASQLYQYQLQRIQEYIDKARELKGQLNTKGNE
jgi:hypothetical protein